MKYNKLLKLQNIGMVYKINMVFLQACKISKSCLCANVFEGKYEAKICVVIFHELYLTLLFLFLFSFFFRLHSSLQMWLAWKHTTIACISNVVFALKHLWSDVEHLSKQKICLGNARCVLDLRRAVVGRIECVSTTTNRRINIIDATHPKQTIFISYDVVLTGVF